VLRTVFALTGLVVGIFGPLAAATAQYNPPTLLFPPFRPLPPVVIEGDDPPPLPEGRYRRPTETDPNDYDPDYRGPSGPSDRDRYGARDYPPIDPREHPYDRDSARVPPGAPSNGYPATVPPVGPQPRQDAGVSPSVGQPNVPRPPGLITPDRAPTGAVGADGRTIMSALPPEVQPETGEPKQLPLQFRRQLVDYRTKEPVGTIIIDTPNTYLYLVMPKGKAMRYGIGVGREGFTWAGVERISQMKEWPDWHPPTEMIERQPYLPRFMAGGPGNPLGARALYLGKTLYRIHGTNQPSTIGQTVSSGCIRLLNEDIEDLYGRVRLGTRVIVLPGEPPATAAATPPVSLTPQGERGPNPSVPGGGPNASRMDRSNGVQSDALPPLLIPRR
jgi:lipoprotein-anchoring transpeptidase ErfK/SrfK